MENFRKNNIEFRVSTNLVTDEPYYEIVMWKKNPYYNKRDDFELTPLGSYYHKELHYYACESLFTKEECCYTIALFKNRGDELEPDLITVGDRIVRMDENDALDFFQVARYGFDEIIKENKEKRC